MATKIREQQEQERSGRQPIRRGQRPIVWPFLAAALTVLVLGGAALMVVTQSEAPPFENEITHQTGGLTGLREGGPYVEVVSPLGSIHYPPPMTSDREGGRYVDQPVSGDATRDPMTAQREG